MIIDFKEIPVANKGGGGQDRFEQFACDLLERMGFEILQRPHRGADGKKDIIVSEIRSGIENKTNIKWLVSCKHYAHSGRSVNDQDEPDIGDRLSAHGCDGFLGFYSTIPASSLSNKLSACKNQFEYTIYDCTRIEKAVLSSRQRERLLHSYFPESAINAHHFISQEKQHRQAEELTHLHLSKEDILEITKTAIIILEIEKIKGGYFDGGFINAESSLRKLYRYSDHSNGKVADAVFRFLQSVADQTRAKMPVAIASSLFQFVLTFSSSYITSKKERHENGSQCLYIGYSLAYDAFIYLDDFEIAAYGLLILKFIYRESKRNGNSDLAECVLEQYNQLEQTLDRPERRDLQDAKELLRAFKNDLDSYDLSFPLFSDHLSKKFIKT